MIYSSGKSNNYSLYEADGKVHLAESEQWVREVFKETLL